MDLLEHRKYVLANLSFITRTELEIKLNQCEEKYKELEIKWKINNALWEDELFNAGMMCSTYRIALIKKPKIETKDLKLSKDNMQYCFF